MNIYTISSFLDVWQGFQYTSGDGSLLYSAGTSYKFRTMFQGRKVAPLKLVHKRPKWTRKMIFQFFLKVCSWDFWAMDYSKAPYIAFWLFVGNSFLSKPSTSGGKSSPKIKVTLTWNESLKWRKTWEKSWNEPNAPKRSAE